MTGPRIRRTSAATAILLLAALTTVHAQEATPKADAKGQIERLLKEGNAAATAGDHKAALGLAERAIRLAEQALPPADPLRARATVEFLRIRTLGHDARSEWRGAIRSATQLRDLYSNAEDARSSLAWADYAHKLAEKYLPETDPERSEAFLEMALLRGIVPRGGDDRADALAWAGRAAEFAEKTYPPGSVQRLRAWNLLASAQPDDEAGRQQGRTLGRRMLDESRGTADPKAVLLRFRALIRLAGIEVVGGQPVGEEIVAGLAAILRSVSEPREFHFAIQIAAPQLVWEPLLARARSDSTDAQGAGERLETDLGRFEAALRRAGVDESVARLGTLALVEFRWERQQLDAVDKALRLLTPTIGGPLVLPFPRGYYWHYLGLLESERSNFDLARSHFGTALETWRGAGMAQEAIAIANLGQLLVRQGDYRGAEARLRESVARYEKSDQLRGSVGHALAIRNLSDVLSSLGQDEAAATLRVEALAMADAIRPADPYAIYLCRNSLGSAAYREGRYAEARAEFEKTRDIARSAFGAGHFHVAEAEVNLGWLDEAKGDLPAALARFQAALAIVRARLGEDHPRHAEVVSYLARIKAGLGEKDEARRLIATALDGNRRHLDRLLRSALSERDRLAILQELRVHPESIAWPGVLDTFVELAPGLGVPVDEQYARVLTWKGSLNRKSATVEGAGKARPELADLDRRRKDVRIRLRNAMFQGGGADRLEALEAEEEDLERQIRSANSRGASARPSLVDLSPAAVSSGLPKGSALLDVIEFRRYHRRPDGEALGKVRSSYAGWLTKPGGAAVRIDLADSTAIDDDVARFVEGLGRDEDVREAGDHLGRSIRDPLLPHLAGISTLILAADGALHRLPMAALPGAKPGSYWVEDLAFASVPTAQSFLERRRGGARPDTRGALIVGGVDYGAQAPDALADRRRARSAKLYNSWLELPQALKEADEAATAFRAGRPEDKVEMVSGKAATKERIREALQRCRYAHLATHGAFYDNQEADSPFGILGVSAGLDSFLVLSDANAGGPDGLLTAEEIESMDLRGLDLVVLSACQSGLGHVRAGQGMVGLPGSLDRAGASAVISTLWSVEDEATRAFMKAYYKHLFPSAGKVGPGEALRAAQVEMIRGGVPSADGQPLSRPSRWAGFVLNGDPFSPTPASP